MSQPHDHATEDDFYDEAVTAEADNSSAAVAIKALNEYMVAEQESIILTEQLKELMSTMSKITTVTLPDALREMGTEIWRDPESGIAVELETAVDATLPKDIDKRNERLDALRPIGIEEIMTEEFTISFSPRDKRTPVIRAILGLAQADQELIEGDEEPAPRLTNFQADLVAQLRESLELSDLPAVEKLGVNAARFKSWLKEKISKGFGVIIKDAGVWYGKHAKIVPPKKKKGA